MNVLQISGLVLIVGCVVTILAAAFNGDRVNLFVIALVLGIVGNILFWLGKPHYEEEDSESPPDKDPKPGNKPPAS